MKTVMFCFKLKKFDVGEGRYHITTGTRELSPVVRGVGMALGGRGGKCGTGGKCAVGEAGRNGGGVFSFFLFLLKNQSPSQKSQKLI